MSLQVTPVGDLNSDTENVPTQAGGGSSLQILDEGVSLDTAVISIDHVGAGIVATLAGAHSIDVTVAGAPGAGGGGASRWDWLYGDGADGTATLDGATAVAGMTLAAGAYTLTRSVAFVNLTVNSGVTLWIANGGVIYVNGTLALNGTISASDGRLDAVGGARGQGAAATYWNPQSGGGNVGVAGDAAGFGGVNLPGFGGAGGAGGGGALAGALVAPLVSQGGRAYLSNYLCIFRGRMADNTRLSGGSGGGGGSGGLGGAGGGGGGCALIAARNITTANPVIPGVYSARGGNGGSATGNNDTGGGGGGGGVLFMFTETASPTTVITFQVTGGARGNGAGTGAAGQPGSAGSTYAYVTD